MGELVKTLEAAKAWEEWMKRKGKVNFKGTVKYTQDHLLTGKNLSKSNVHEAAVDRYIKDNATGQRTFTWMSSSEGDLVQMAARTRPDAWRAKTYQGKQQLLVKVKIETWTVDVAEVKKQQALNVKSQKKFNIIERGKRYFIVSKPKTLKASYAIIVGDWNPMQAEATLYHYDAKPLPTKHEFLDKYRKWWCECDEKGRVKKVKKPQVKS